MSFSRTDRYFAALHYSSVISQAGIKPPLSFLVALAPRRKPTEWTLTKIKVCLAPLDIGAPVSAVTAHLNAKLSPKATASQPVSEFPKLKTSTC